MQRENRPLDKWRTLVFVCIGLLVLAADQLSKEWIRTNLGMGETLLDTGIFRIIRIHNTGAAFGIFRDHNLTIMIAAIIGIIAILAFVFFLSRRWPFFDSMLVWAAIGLAVGGTLGNLVDRLRLGYVTDFIDFRVWPAFNVADAAVTVCAIIIIFYLIVMSQTGRHQE